MKITQWLFRFLRVVAIIGVGVMVFSYLMRTKAEPTRRVDAGIGPLVEVTRAESATLTMTVEAFGTAQSKIDLTLVARVAGEIVEASPDLREGRYVEEGDLLLRIDPRTYDLVVKRLESMAAQADIELLRLDQDKVNAEADLQLANERVQLLKNDVERMERLVRSQSDSAAARDRSEVIWLEARRAGQTIENQLALWPSVYAKAENGLSQIKVQLEEAILNVEFTEIHAPFSGRVSARLVEAGQYVAPGTPLAQMYDNDAMEIPLWLSIENVQWLDVSGLLARPNSDDKGNPNPIAAEAFLEVGRNQYRWTGSVSRVDARIDEATRMGNLIVEIDAPQAASDTGAPMLLVPGLFVRVLLQGREMENIITLPRSVIDETGSVWVVEEGIISPRQVSVLRHVDNLAYIDAGIESGDVVVLTPLSAPVEGMNVRVAGSGFETSAGIPSDLPFDSADGDEDEASGS